MKNISWWWVIGIWTIVILLWIMSYNDITFDEIMSKIGYERVEKNKLYDNSSSYRNENYQNLNDNYFNNSWSNPKPSTNTTKYEVNAKMYYFINDGRGGFFKSTNKYVSFDVWIDSKGLVWSTYGPVRASSVRGYDFECNSKDRLFVFNCDYIY